jgi:hypothetical protein
MGMPEIITVLAVVFWLLLGHVERSAGRKPIGKFAWLARCLAGCIMAAAMGVFGFTYFTSKPPDWLAFGFACFACMVCLWSAVYEFRRRRQIEKLLAEGKIDTAIKGG